MRPNGRGHLWRSLLATAGLTAAVVAGTGSQQSAQAYATPVTRTDLINALAGISGSHTLSGIFQNPQTPDQWTQKYHDITGRYPGLWGSDFLFDAPTVAARQNIVDQGRIEWANGSVIALSFHTCPPTTGSTCDWTKDIEGHLTDAQWNQVVTDGTALNTALKRRLDEAVPYLRQFKDAGIPVRWASAARSSAAPPAGPVIGLTGKCADIPGGNTADGTPAQLWTCNGSPQQSWTAGSDGTLRTLGKCLDVTGQNTADGTRLQIWTCSGQTNQQWTLPS